jgi:hypothetical protein
MRKLCFYVVVFLRVHNHVSPEGGWKTVSFEVVPVLYVKKLTTK